MRLVLFLLVLTSSQIVNAQWNYREDTSCYRTQKIIIPYNDLHEVKSMDHSQKNDLFYYVYLMNREKNLYIDRIQASERPILPYMDEIESGLNKSEPLHEYFDYEMNQNVYAYEFILHSDVIFDEFGEPLTQYNENGNPEYVWGSTDSIIYTFYGIPEVLLTTSKGEDWNGESSDLRILTIQMQGVLGDKRQVFSFSLDQFMKKMGEYLINKRINLPWYQKLVDDNYKGYRYYQIPCDMDFNGF